MEDFPDEMKELTREPSDQVSRGDNGLVYVEFAVRNTTNATIQAVVRGPEKHPFGYGLPLRPNRKRIEKWPVGTNLYRTLGGVRADRLLTVEEGFAGKTVDVSAADH